ncbi:MAG TPA: methionine adenosyltransferase [Ktedonobacteraceae bacterium]
MDLVIRTVASTSPAFQEIEVVERKGLGHPDTICDAVAEHVCVCLCRYYLKHFGLILHHNVDKVLLCGGTARAAFGGGEIIEPIELYVAGRATLEYLGERIPVHEIAVEACKEWLGKHLQELDVERHIRIIPRLRPGSADLTRVFARGDAAPLANDTSVGAGFAPLTVLEKVVLEVERQLNSPETKHTHPEIGTDIKVMGIRRGSRIHLTIGCAFVGRFVSDAHDYDRKKDAASKLALAAARQVTGQEVEVTMNAADRVDHRDEGDVFLTVTGTSAEAGDDGEVGRGNRACGLITPYRSMTLEAVAGKNPVNHVGKLYNLVASRIAAAITAEIRGVPDAACVLVSQIGRPVTDPQVVDVRMTFKEPRSAEAVKRSVGDIVRSELGRLDELRDALIEERIPVY